MGIAYWACRSCLSFVTEMNTRLEEVDKTMIDQETEREEENLDGMDEEQEMIDQQKEREEENLDWMDQEQERKDQQKEEENLDGMDQEQEIIDNVEKRVGQLEQKVEDMEKHMEDEMYEEMRSREAIRRNLVLYGVKEQIRGSDKERRDADLAECETIFGATGARADRSDIRFCKRIGARESSSKGTRPILVGMRSEDVKVAILDAAKELRKTRYRQVRIGPDQTRKQRQAEIKLEEEVERKNKEELSEQDRSKNLKWMVVGRRGEKRIVKASVRKAMGAERRGTQTERGRQNERKQLGDGRQEHFQLLSKRERESRS